MKLVKMSLAAALLVSGAYALDNVKVNGSAKLIYQTTDTKNTTVGLFDREGANGQVSATLGTTADLVDNISAGAEVQVLSTLGLETNLVDGVMNASNGTTDSWNMSQIWMAATYGKTTAKVGRMELDTPLAFTEKWNIVKNTFEAAVLINTDLPDTTLVGAYVGAHNGLADTNNTITAGGQSWSTVNMGQTSNTGNGDSQGFQQFWGGAYAVGAIYAGIENTTLQAWYYDVNTLADAFWLQADIKNIADMINVGVQYATIDPTKDNVAGLADTAQDLDAWAVKVSGTVSDVNLFVAYSDVDSATGNGLAMANTATQDKTKLYTGTASIYFDGAVVGMADTSAWKIGASTKVSDYALTASYAAADRGDNNTATNAQTDFTAYDLSVGTKVGAIALKAIYTNYEVDGNAAGLADSERDTVRVIASVKF